MRSRAKEGNIIIMKYSIETYSKSKVFFTSDTHFFHSKIIGYTGRPFENVEQMNQTLIENWNRVVPRDGIVFHLGDFAFASEENWNSILDKLKGKIYLILGNHDMKMAGKEVMNRFEEVTLQKIIRVDGREILLNHYPFLCYSGAYREEWQLFGHVHSGAERVEGIDIPRLVNLFPTQYDVGVDNNNYTPVSYEQVKAIIESRTKG